MCSHHAESVHNGNLNPRIDPKSNFSLQFTPESHIKVMRTQEWSWTHEILDG